MVPAGRTRRPALATSPDRVARAYRRARPLAHTRERASWLTNLSEDERTRFRELGRQLVGDLLAHLDGERESLARAERHAGDYGAEAATLGASLSDTVDGFLRFRKPFIDELVVLARKRRLDANEATALLVDAESALDRVLVALMTGRGKQ